MRTGERKGRTRLVNEDAEKLRRRRWQLASKVERAPSGKYHWLVLDELAVVYARGVERSHTIAREVARNRARVLKLAYGR